MRHEPCETKSLHNALAAQSGVEAALLAAHGVRGPAHLLEGPHGLFAAMTDGADANNVMQLPLEGWLIHEVSFKPWPACRHAHPSIDAALAARASLEAAGRSVDDIASVGVATYRSAIDFCDKPTPRTVLEAKFSLQHCAAVVLAHGRPSMAHFEDAAIGSPTLAAWRAKVRVIERPEMSQAFPQHYAAAVTLTLRDGTVFTHTQADAWGDPELPMSANDVIGKARELLAAAGLADEKRIDDLLAATMALNKARDIREWTALWPSARGGQAQVSQHVARAA
jgi:2-methylcitrate dehydratase PrpD